MTFLRNLRQQKLLSVTLLAFTLSIGILIGTLINGGHAQKTEGVKDAHALIPNPSYLSTAFSALAKQLEPSVVNITSTYGAARPAQPAEPAPHSAARAGGGRRRPGRASSAASSARNPMFRSIPLPFRRHRRVPGSWWTTAIS